MPILSLMLSLLPPLSAHFPFPATRAPILDALLVVLVGGIAARAGSAVRAAGVTLATALLVLGNLTRASSTTRSRSTTGRGSRRRSNLEVHARLIASHARLLATGRASGTSRDLETARNDSGAGHDVGADGTVDVGGETGVRGAVRAGELDARGDGGAGAARDGDLVARHVELGGHGVERDDLGAEEVVAVGDVGGDGHVDLAAARVHVLDAPVVVVADGAGRRPPVLENLEEVGRAVRRLRVGHLGEVDDDGAVVGAANGLGSAGSVTGLLVHLDSHGAAGLDGALGAHALGAAGVAANVGAAGVGHGGVGHGDTSALGRIILSINPKLLEKSMAGDLLGRKGGDESEECRLHLELKLALFVEVQEVGCVV